MYRFKVQARNSAGNSSQSEELDRRIPSFPVIEDSLEYSLSKDGNGVTLNLTLQVGYNDDVYT